MCGVVCSTECLVNIYGSCTYDGIYILEEYKDCQYNESTTNLLVMSAA